MNFTNHFIISMPHLSDPFFERCIVLLCDHTDDGAMGLIINKNLPKARNIEILKQTKLWKAKPKPRIYMGGPVQMNRGLVLHDTNYKNAETQKISQNLLLTTNKIIVDDLVDGKGPEKFRIMFGYAGWSPGQLEREYENGDWLMLPASNEFIFDIPDEKKWKTASSTFGIDVSDFYSKPGFS